MDLLNVTRKASKIKFGIGLIIVGLIFTVISCIIVFSPKKNYIQTEATITQVFQEEDADGNETLSADIEYEVNGTKYQLSGFPISSAEAESGVVQIQYDEADPESAGSVGGEFIPYVILVLGVGAIVYGAITLVKSIKTKVADMNEYDKVDVSSEKAEMLREERKSEDLGPIKDYFFHFGGKMNQSNFLDDDQKNTVYEGKLIKFSLFGKSEYEFINHLTGRKQTLFIGKTVSTSNVIGEGFSFRVPITCKFKINDEDNWDYLAKLGLAFDYYLDGITMCFNVKYFGEKIAEVRMAGTNDLTGKNALIGKLPTNGLYNVKCHEADIEKLFMVCLSLSKALFTEVD